MMEATLRHQRNDKQRGYSLAEILVAVAVFAVIFVAALLIYDRSNRVFKSGVESSDLQQNTRIAFDKLVAELRMAGYDFDRDGEPSTTGVYQQGDEQLEYIGPGAITFRGNFDAESDAANNNGRETAYEPTGGRFPIVTTGNDEIVTYVLRSKNASANTDSITFYADTRKRRAGYPGGSDEQTVTIPAVDDCADGSYNWDGCRNPPYTLYRVTLKDEDLSNPNNENNFIFTPIAENIRRIRFYYFKDPAGTAAQMLAPNGGVGKMFYNSVTPSANIDARVLRESVQSIRLELVGMNAVADTRYLSPTETSTDVAITSPVSALTTAQQVTSAKTYRQYPLASHIVPRNLGRRGMQEYDTHAPGAPTVTGAAYGCCGVAYVTWDPPPSGIVDGYTILYDTSPTGPFASEPVQAGLNTFGYVPGLDPAMAGGYHFIVVASNSFGSERSLNVFPASDGSGLIPINRTKAEAPTMRTATGNASGAPVAVANNVILRWRPPAQNVPYGGQNPTLSNGLDATVIPSASEIAGYDIHRSTTPDFTPDYSTDITASSTTRIWAGLLTAPGAPIKDTGTGEYVFTDTTSKQNCTTYYYRVRAFERCYDATTKNQPADKELSFSDFSDDIGGQTTAGPPPRAPENVAIDPASTCSTDPCTVRLTWPKVVLDTSTPTPANIQIDSYEVLRSTRVSGTETDREVYDAPDNPLNGSAVRFTDTEAPQPPNANTVYWYTVRARQCGNSSVSGWSSPPKVFPCTTLTIVPPAALDGTGAQSNPWLVGTSTARVGVTTSTDIASANAVVYNETSGGVGQTLSPATSGVRARAYDVDLGGNDNAIYRLEITITDVNGCSSTEIRWVQDSPSGCCIQPWKEPDGTIFNDDVVTSLGTNDGVLIKLFNMCGEVLTINSIALEFDTTGNRDLQTVIFPNGSGGTVTKTYSPVVGSPQTITLPAGAQTTIPAETATPTAYEITVKFDANFSRSNLNNFCVTYTTPAGSSTRCRVAPQASSSGDCNP